MQIRNRVVEDTECLKSRAERNITENPSVEPEPIVDVYLWRYEGLKSLHNPWRRINPTDPGFKEILDNSIERTPEVNEIEDNKRLHLLLVPEYVPDYNYKEMKRKESLSYNQSRLLSRWEEFDKIGI